MSKGEGSEMVRPNLYVKLIVFTSSLVAGEENVKCWAGQWARAGSAAAVLKLKWHFLSEAFCQTALFCPFTCNLCDTQTPITKNKSGRLKHTAVIEETESGFQMGGGVHGVMVPADGDIAQNEKCISQTSLWRPFKRGVSKPQTLHRVYVSLVQKCIPLLSCMGPKGKDWVSSFPPLMKLCINNRQRWNLDHIITLLTP